MELSTPHSDPPVPLGLAIFQNLRNLEYVRSIHIFQTGGYIHMIQQEFLSKGWSFQETSAPTYLACLSGKAHVNAYMDMVRAEQETQNWKCLLDFCTSPPRKSQTESVESHTLVVNAWAKANALFANLKTGVENNAINWQRPQWLLPCLSARLQGPKVTKQKDHCLSIESPPQKLQLDLWQQWGSDLELASPRISQAFQVPSFRNSAPNAAIADPMLKSNCNRSRESSSWTQNPSVQAPYILLDVMEENSEMGRNLTGLTCNFVLPPSQFESIWGESSANCKYFGTMPLDCAVSSASNTYSSSDEKGLDAENSGTSDQPKNDSANSHGFSKAKRQEKKYHKPGSARATTGRLTELTKDELTHYFNMPITQASKELNVGLTVLKKRCRIFGIPRWPHRKMKSINSLIHNLQDLVKGNGGDKEDDANHVQVAVEDLEKQKKEMQESPGIQLEERTKRLRQACFKASYRKRRQEAFNDLSTDDHHNAAMSSSNSNSFNQYCE